MSKGGCWRPSAAALLPTSYARHVPKHTQACPKGMGAAPHGHHTPAAPEQGWQEEALCQEEAPSGTRLQLNSSISGQRGQKSGGKRSYELELGWGLHWDGITDSITEAELGLQRFPSLRNYLIHISEITTSMGWLWIYSPGLTASAAPQPACLLCPGVRDLAG